MKGKKVLVGTWIACVLVIGWRSFHNGSGMPVPKTLFAANVTWSLLAFLSMASEELAGTLSVGIVVALLVTNSSILGQASTSVKLASTGTNPTSQSAILASTTPTPYASTATSSQLA